MTHFEDRQEKHPCRCGKTHVGDYAAYDYGHHMCFHNDNLIFLSEERDYVMCPLCGNTWMVEETGHQLK